jgi:hypothetical protein
MIVYFDFVIIRNVKLNKKHNLLRGNGVRTHLFSEYENTIENKKIRY